MSNTGEIQLALCILVGLGAFHVVFSTAVQSYRLLCESDRRKEPDLERGEGQRPPITTAAASESSSTQPPGTRLPPLTSHTPTGAPRPPRSPVRPTRSDVPYGRYSNTSYFSSRDFSLHTFNRNDEPEIVSPSGGPSSPTSSYMFSNERRLIPASRRLGAPPSAAPTASDPGSPGTTTTTTATTHDDDDDDDDASSSEAPTDEQNSSPPSSPPSSLSPLPPMPTFDTAPSESSRDYSPDSYYYHDPSAGSSPRSRERYFAAVFDGLLDRATAAVGEGEGEGAGAGGDGAAGAEQPLGGEASSSSRRPPAQLPADGGEEEEEEEEGEFEDIELDDMAAPPRPSAPSSFRSRIVERRSSFEMFAADVSRLVPTPAGLGPSPAGLEWEKGKAKAKAKPAKWDGKGKGKARDYDA